MKPKLKFDTIVAQATPPGCGGVGIIRISGDLVPAITQSFLGEIPSARLATFTSFFDGDKKVIDQGLALYFNSPFSFTGEDVLELHGHGGQVVMDLLLKRAIELGARLARPGEFVERAFLNNKLDLAQAEAVADLVNASSSQAAQNAVRSLQGEFSKHINSLVALLINLRSQVEASIDFPEEDETSLSDKFGDEISNILNQIIILQDIATQGVILRDGSTIVLTGKPNAGKSSILNCLSGRDMAIVTPIPGTTRDILHSRIQIDGIPVHLLDTAGLHDKPDLIESEGIRRAWDEIKKADHVLLVVDAFANRNRDPSQLWSDFFGVIPPHAHFSVIYNKVDLTDEHPQVTKINNIDCIYFSAKTGLGLDLLRNHIKASVGFHTVESGFSARRRHLEALTKAKKFLYNALTAAKGGVLELIAEDLSQAQHALSEITGEVTTEDLLEKIFAEFCIGK